MWERINYYYLWMQSADGPDALRHRPQRLLQPDQADQPADHGISDGTMSHGEAWEFFQLGKYLERASQTARILDVKYHILLPTPEHVGTPDRQRPLGGDPDELLGLRAVPQAAAGRRTRESRSPTS